MMRRCAGAAVLAIAVLLSACGSGASPSASTASSPSASAPAITGRAGRGSDWTRFDYDAQRSGVGPRRTGIGPGQLHRLRRRVVHIDGVADSSAIELHAVKVRGRLRDVAFVTTTYGRTIAIDIRSGAKLWEFVPSDIGTYEGSPQVTTATPVADPSRHFIYAASPDGLIRKLRVSDGAQVKSGGWPARITFDATREKIGGALNLSGRYVVAATGGYIGDAPVYQGHVALIDRRSGRVAHVWNSLCSDRRQLIDPPTSCGVSDSAIWAREGTVIERGSGRILVATGNGPFNGSTDWGDSVLELSADATRLLQNWTPTNQSKLNSSDTDLGSTEPALLPHIHGRRLAVQGGKQGIFDLLDLGRLNGTTGGPSARTGGELQRIPTPGGGQLLSAPAVWSHRGSTYLFAADANGTSAYVLTPGAQPRLAVAWQEGAAGTSPVLAGGLLYVYDPASGDLNIRNPLTGHLDVSLPAGSGHWNSPIVVSGRIVLPVGGSSADNDAHGIVNIYSVR